MIMQGPGNCQDIAKIMTGSWPNYDKKYSCQDLHKFLHRVNENTYGRTTPENSEHQDGNQTPDLPII